MSLQSLFIPIMSNEIVWDEDGFYRKSKTGVTITSGRGIIYETMIHHSRQILCNPKEFMTDPAAIPLSMPLYRNLISYHIQNMFDFEFRHAKLKEEIPKVVTEKMLEYLETIKEPENDFEFLLRLSRKQNWKSGCCICLADEMMGTTCGCGHTEIVVFRPCGHSICIEPCYSKFLKSKGYEMPMSKDGHRLKINVTEDNLPFVCMLCQCKIDRTFQAEEVRIPEKFQDILKEQIDGLLK